MFNFNTFRNSDVDGICIRDFTKGLIHEKFQKLKVTHILEPPCSTPLLDWIRSHYWSDVDNYKKRYKYECCNDSRYYEEELWVWCHILESVDG